MKIADEETHRVLAYIGALNEHGEKPHHSLVEAYADQPHRRTKRTGRNETFQALTAIRLAFEGREVSAETAVEYLHRLGWISMQDGGVELTSTGRALLQALHTAELESTDQAVLDVVLSANDPFAYARVLGQLAGSESALLVDPYLKLDQFLDVLDLENITRILIGPRLNAGVYRAMAAALNALPEGRTLAVRKTPDIHDRYLIPGDSQPALMLGTSLNGFGGRKLSTITTLGGLSSDALRSAHEEIWDRAEPVEPRQLEAGNGTSDAGPPSA
jgi:hypothetical protein